MESVIFEDCINLIEKFMESDNPHFECFCVQWKSMMFMHVYSAQTTTIEVIQTTKSIIHLAKRIVCAKDEVGKVVSQVRDSRQQLLRRIGGLYLLYAIYFKQPTKQYVKVLVCPETWLEISSFIQNLPMDPQMDEVRYIFWRLYKSDAFRFAALDYDVGLENMVDYDKIYDIHRGREKAEVVRIKLKLKLQAISEAERVLPEMVELEDNYNNIKQSLSNSEKSIMQNALPPTNIFHDIQDVIKNIHDILDEKTEETRTVTTKSKGGNINETRKELKRKAAGLVNHSLENAESNNEDNESAVEDSSSQGVDRKYFGKMSSRSMIGEKLPDHIMDDLENSSSEDQGGEEEEENTCENESEEEDQQEHSESDEADRKMASSPQSITSETNCNIK